VPLHAHLLVCLGAKQMLTEDPQCLSDLANRLESLRSLAWDLQLYDFVRVLERSSI